MAKRRSSLILFVQRRFVKDTERESWELIDGKRERWAVGGGLSGFKGRVLPSNRLVFTPFVTAGANERREPEELGSQRFSRGCKYDWTFLEPVKRGRGRYSSTMSLCPGPDIPEDVCS